MEKKNMICEKAGLCTFVHCHNRTVHQKDEDCGLDTCSEFPEKVKCVEYSDPPSPKMVCPECAGTGENPQTMGNTKCETCHGTGSVEPYDDDIRKCPKCNGTGKVPSPEPPEKVRDLLLTDEQITKAQVEAVSLHDLAVHVYFEDCKEDSLKQGRGICQAQLLKLQQAGWGEISGKDAEIAELERVLDNWRKLATERYDKNREQEARIKELGAINSNNQKLITVLSEQVQEIEKYHQPEYETAILQQARKEARQQALKDAYAWLSAHWKDIDSDTATYNRTDLDRFEKGEIPENTKY